MRYLSNNINKLYCNILKHPMNTLLHLPAAVSLLVIIFTPVYAEDAASLVERAKALQQAGQSQQAKPLYEQAAALGSSEAHFMLSYSYSLPLAEDIAHLSQAARAGHPKAFYYLTDRLLTRGGTENSADPVRLGEVLKQYQSHHPDFNFDYQTTLDACIYAGKPDFNRLNALSAPLEEGYSYRLWQQAENLSKLQDGNNYDRQVLQLICYGAEVPAELDIAVKDRLKLDHGAKQTTEFDLCNAITSGMGMGFCASREEQRLEQQRLAKQEGINQSIKQRLGQAPLKLLEPANRAFELWLQAKTSREEGHGGSGRSAFIIGSQSEQRQNYLARLEMLSKGEQVVSTFPDFAGADKELNRVYRALMKKLRPADDPELYMFEVTKEDLRAVQRLWLKYRDSNARLFAALQESTTEQEWQALLTQERSEQLKTLLEWQ